MAFRQAVLTFNPDRLRSLIEEAGLGVDESLDSSLHLTGFADTKDRNELCCALLGRGISYRRIADCFIPPLSPSFISGMPSLSRCTLQPKQTQRQKIDLRVNWLMTTEEGQKEVAKVMGEAAREERFWRTRLCKDVVLKALGIPPTYRFLRHRAWEQLQLEELRVGIVIRYGLELNPKELFADPGLSHFSNEDWAAFINYLGRQNHLLRVGAQSIAEYRRLVLIKR